MHSNMIFGIFGVVLQLIIIIVYVVIGEYDSSALPKQPTNKSKANADLPSLIVSYPYFKDAHLMIYPAFATLMTYLVRYRMSTIAISISISALAGQLGMLIFGLTQLSGGKVVFGIDLMFIGEFTAAAVMISVGAILGKTTPLQTLIMVIIEVPLCIANEYIGKHYLLASDVGGSMFIHVFAAYFGIFIARVLNTKESTQSSNEGTSSASEMFSVLGGLFLWVCWPSFNAAAAVGVNGKHRAVVNSYLALLSAALGTCSMSALVGKGHSTMAHLQNSILAGGVAIGATADMLISPGFALLIGFLSSVISVTGFTYLMPALTKRGFHETCGINNLHGMPGVFAGIASIFAAAFASAEKYGADLEKVFPGRKSRTAGVQALYQLAALALTFAFAAVGGTITGFLLKLEFLHVREENGSDATEATYFRDDLNFNMPEFDENVEIRKRPRVENIELNNQNC